VLGLWSEINGLNYTLNHIVVWKIMIVMESFPKHFKTVMFHNVFNINKTNNPLSPQLIKLMSSISTKRTIPSNLYSLDIKKKTRHVTLEIHVLAWDSHKNKAALNRLMVHMFVV